MNTAFRIAVTNAALARAERMLGTSKPPKTPVVVKQASVAKTVGGTRAMIRYIGRYEGSPTEEAAAPGVKVRRRGRPRKVLPDPKPLPFKRPGTPGPGPERRLDRDDGDIQPVFRDEAGAIIERDRVFQHLDAWRLLADHENLRSEIQKRRGADKRAPVERFRLVQARHLIISFPVRTLRDELAFEIAIGDTIRSTFQAWGYPVLWALHREHGKEVHAHLVVRNRPYDPLQKSLHITRDMLMFDALRQVTAEQLADLGIEADPSRRVDRPELLERLLEDRRTDIAANSRRPFETRLGRWYRGDALRQQARRFTRIYGPDGGARFSLDRVGGGMRAALAREIKRLDPIERERVLKVEAILRVPGTVVVAGKPAPDAAIDHIMVGWLRLREEDPRLGSWYLRNRADRILSKTGIRVGSGLLDLLNEDGRRARRRSVIMSVMPPGAVPIVRDAGPAWLGKGTDGSVKSAQGKHIAERFRLARILQILSHDPGAYLAAQLRKTAMELGALFREDGTVPSERGPLAKPGGTRVPDREI